MADDTRVGKLVVEIVGDTSGLISAYDEASKQTTGFEGKLRNISSTLSGIGAELSLKVTAPLALAGVGMVKLAGDAAETQSKFEQVFGEMSADVDAWADTYGAAAGRASTDLKDMLATTGSIVKAMGFAGEEGAEFSETIAQLSVDMGSFHNASDLEAFNALRSAITGEYEPMKRFGVVINEAKVEQELLNMGIAGGTKAATDAEKAQARMNLILAATSDAQGDAERTADSFSNQVKALQSDLKEAAETLGSELLPMAQGALSVARDAIGWIGGLDEGTRKVIITTSLFTASIGPATWAVGTLAGGVGNMITLYRTYQASTLAATVATKGFTAAIAANPVGLAIIGLTTLGAVLLPLIASTRDATDATDDYNAALGKTPDLSNLTIEAIDEEIKRLEESIRLKREAASLLRGEAGPATRAAAADTRAAANATAGLTQANDDLVLSFHDSLRATNQQGSAMDRLSKKEKILQADLLDEGIANDDAALKAYKHEKATRALADGAETAYKKASKAVSTHQKAVSDLQKEYDDLKEAIDTALGIDEEIEDSGRDVERAEIRKIRAKQDLADLDREIADKEQEMAATDYGSPEKRKSAERELEDLKLRRREAVLDVADAEDAYTDALEEQAETQRKKTELEEQLNGESIASAQARLDEIGTAIDEETEKLEGALKARETAQTIHEEAMNQLNNDALETKSKNWKTYVEYVASNPAMAATVHVEYDSDGNMIGAVPTITVPDIQTPTYAGLASQETSALDEAVANGTYNYGHNARGEYDRALGGGQAQQAPAPQVTINQTVNTTTQSAAEVQAATKRGLRDGFQEVLS